MYRKREQRKCETCKKKFWFRLCYAKRPHNAGRFCSLACKFKASFGSGNPRWRGGGGHSTYGNKKVQHARQLAYYQRLRQRALEHIATTWGRDIQCFHCGCRQIKVLQVNHIKDKGSRESGNRLWHIVLRSRNTKKYDIRCIVCNWAHMVERDFGIVYQIRVRGEGIE